MRFGGNRGNGLYGQADPRGGFPPGPGMMPTGIPPTGMMPTGVPPAGVPPTGISSPGRIPTGVPSSERPSSGMQNFGGIDQIPMQAPGPMLGGAAGGSIRNNLGSELKKRGFFQKDGQINNLRGGLFGGGNMGTGPFSFLGNGGGSGGQGGPGMPQARQFMLEAAQAGINANGIATISPDNVFSCIANLPSPNTLMGQGIGTYAAYLVDNKGQTGFLAGVLRPVGNGVYQAQFRSQVPLAHYSRVIISVENAQQLGHVPQGPIVLQVKQPMGPVRFLTPIKNAGGSVWKRLSGLIQRKPKVPVLPEGGGIPTEIAPPVNIEPLMGNPPINPMN